MHPRPSRVTIKSAHVAARVKKRRQKIKDKGTVARWTLVYIGIGLLGIFMSLPLIYMISTALKPLGELYLFPPTFLTQSPTLQNFRKLFETASDGSIPITRYIFNSIVSTGCVVTFSVLICSMGAYSLEKLRPPGHEKIFKMVF